MWKHTTNGEAEAVPLMVRKDLSKPSKYQLDVAPVHPLAWLFNRSPGFYETLYEAENPVNLIISHILII